MQFHTTYSFGDALENEVRERFEVLRLQIILVLHHVDFEIDESSIRQDGEAALPAAKEAVGFLLEDANFPNIGEEVVQNLLHEAWVALLHLASQTFVPHEQLLLGDVVAHSEHGVGKCILIGHVLVVDLGTFSHLMESLQCAQIVVNSALSNRLLLVLFPSLLLFKPALDFFLDEHGLAGCGGDLARPILLKFLLFCFKLLLLELDLSFLGLHLVSFIDEL